MAGNDATVSFQPGVYTNFNIPNDLFDSTNYYFYKNGIKEKGVHGVYFNGKNLEGDTIYESDYKKLDLADEGFWTPNEIPKELFSARYTCFYSPIESGYYSIGACGDDGYRIKIDGSEIINMWRDQSPEKTMNDIYLESNKEYKIEIEYFQAVRGAVLQFGIKKSSIPAPPDKHIEMAVKAATKADLVIFAVGFNPLTEEEGYDRTFEMPYNQSKLIQEVSKVNNNTIVVLNAGGNVEMESWLDNIKALLMAWYPGQEGSRAVAEIIFGITNPSGKLPASFAKRWEENPTYNSYFDDNKDLNVDYSEGLFLGYRYWDNVSNKPLFPFGFGLSYTNFKISNLTCNNNVFKIGDAVEISVKLANTGKMKGAEVVQLYVSDKECTYIRPIKEMKAFKKIELEPQEDTIVKFVLGNDAFTFFNPSTEKWELESGTFEILVGNSSNNICEKKTIEFQN